MIKKDSKCLPAGRQGFTLLEVLVSATIIAVLTVIGVVSYSSVNKRSRDVKRKSDLEQVRSALEMFRADNGAYPGVGAGSWINASGLDTGGASGLVSTYMPAVPDDPDSDQDYFYEGIQTAGVYASYCVCGYLESIGTGPAQSTCTVSLPASCNYGLKNP